LGRRYAEILQENRGFTPEEEALFDAGANSAYREFRDKAAGKPSPANQMCRMHSAFQTMIAVSIFKQFLQSPFRITPWQL